MSHIIYGNRTVAENSAIREPWYSDGGLVWRWRAIHHSPTGSLDFVWDRGGFLTEEPPSEFIRKVTKSKELKAWSKKQSGDSDDTFTADDGEFHFRATNNRSYGYTYLWAWKN